jgi:cell shape-determining protein MreC
MTEQEVLAKIKDLKEENELLKQELDYITAGRSNTLNKYRELQEENEKLREAVVKMTLERLGA